VKNWLYALAASFLKFAQDCVHGALNRFLSKQTDKDIGETMDAHGLRKSPFLALLNGSEEPDMARPNKDDSRRSGSAGIRGFGLSP